MSDLDKLDQTVDGIIGVLAGITAAKDALSLSDDQVTAFCDATPNGSELWDQFKARRNSEETPNGYNFTLFVIEVLAKTSRPVNFYDPDNTYQSHSLA